MNGSVLDLVFLCVVVLFALVGVIRGFIRELFARGAPVIALWMAMLFYRRANALVSGYVKVEVLSGILSFLAVFIVVYVVLMVVRNIVGKVFGGDIFKGLDRLLGFAFGVVEGLAVVALLLILMQAQPWFDVQELLSQSVFFKALRWVVANPGLFVPGATPPAAQETAA